MRHSDAILVKQNLTTVINSQYNFSYFCSFLAILTTSLKMRVVSLKMRVVACCHSRKKISIWEIYVLFNFGNGYLRYNLCFGIYLLLH